LPIHGILRGSLPLCGKHFDYGAVPIHGSIIVGMGECCMRTLLLEQSRLHLPNDIYVVFVVVIVVVGFVVEVCKNDVCQE